jgi:hypothetical protein
VGHGIFPYSISFIRTDRGCSLFLRQNDPRSRLWVPNRRPQERERAAARAAAEAKRVEAERNAPPMRQSWRNTEFFAPSARSNLKKQAGRVAKKAQLTISRKERASVIARQG